MNYGAVKGATTESKFYLLQKSQTNEFKGKVRFLCSHIVEFITMQRVRWHLFFNNMQPIPNSIVTVTCVTSSGNIHKFLLIKSTQS